MKKKKNKYQKYDDMSTSRCISRIVSYIIGMGLGLLFFKLTGNLKNTTIINSIIPLFIYSLYLIRKVLLFKKILSIRESIHKYGIDLDTVLQFNNKQIIKIHKAIFHYGLKIENIDIIANPLFKSYRMDLILNGLKNKWTIDKLTLYTNILLNDSQLSIIEDGLLFGLSADKVNLYAKPDINVDIMSRMEKRLEEMYIIEKIETQQKLV